MEVLLPVLTNLVFTGHPSGEFDVRLTQGPDRMKVYVRLNFVQQVVMLCKKKDTSTSFCISGSLLEEERNTSMTSAEQVQNDVKQIDKSIVDLWGNFSSMLGRYRVTYNNKLLFFNLKVVYAYLPS